VLPVVQYAVLLALFGGGAPPTAAEQAAQDAFFDGIVDRVATGSYVVALQENLAGLIEGRYPDILFTGRLFKVLAMFLLGLYVGRRRLFADPAAHRPLLRRVAACGLAVGLPANVALAALMETGAYYRLQPLGLVESLVYAAGVPALALAYAAGLALLFLHPAWPPRLAVLALPGRMALTHYLAHSVVCMLAFGGYGLGYFGRVGLLAGTACAVAIFAAQVVLSRWWLARFRFGPAEWLWRSLTYGRRQPLRHPQRAAGEPVAAA
jgi:uncharacterized protein